MWPHALLLPLTLSLSVRKKRVDILRSKLDIPVFWLVMFITATGTKESCRDLCCGQCRSARNDCGCVTWVAWPALVHCWMAGQLLASIGPFPKVTVTFCILLSGILLAAFFFRRLGRGKA